MPVEPRRGVASPPSSRCAELLAIDEFSSRWSAHPVAEKRRGTKRLEHPDVGAVDLAFEVLLLADDDQQLVTWRAADAASEERLATLVRDGQPVSPAQLSVVVNR